jgi:hypothetical protein
LPGDPLDAEGDPDEVVEGRPELVVVASFQP